MGFPIKSSYEINNLTRIVNKDDILNYLTEYQKALSFYRAYPDKLLDLYITASGPDCSFRILDFQRVMLRTLARNQDVFMTFSRGTSKSFVDDIWNIECCILYPNSKLAICAGTKGQSAAILESKVAEILEMLPILKFEIKKISKIKDQYTVYFKNGSQMSNLAAKPSSRGLRFTGLAIEEINLLILWFPL